MQKKSLLLKKTRSRQRQRKMAMANLDIIAPLPRFWASIKTCIPLPKCNAPNTSFDKAAHIFAKEIVSIVLDMLNPKTIEFQKIMMEKLWCLPCLHPLLPGFFQNQKQLQQCATICKSIYNAWSGLKYGIKKDKYVVRNVAKVIVVSSSDLNCLQAGKCCLIMNKIIVHRMHQQKKLIYSQEIGHKWVKADRKLRKDGLTQFLRDLVFKW
jgi:hypothetical protein